MPSNSAHYVRTTGAELHDRIASAHERFASLALRVDPDRPVDDRWTPRDVVAHVVTVMNRYTAFEPGRLASTPRGVDEINERELDRLADLSIGDLTERLSLEMARFAALWTPELPLDTPLPFHAGATIDLQAGLTNVIGEFVMHGHDVATSADETWTIADRDAAILGGFATQILPFYVRPDAPEMIVRFDIDGVAPWVLDSRGVQATVAPPSDDEPDVVFAGRAQAAAMLFYRRTDVAGAQRLGLRVVGGLSPDRAPSFDDLLESP